MAIKRTTLIAYSLFLLLLTMSVCNSAQSVLLNDYVTYFSLQSSSQGLIGTSQSCGSLVMIVVSGLFLRWRGKTFLIGLCALLLFFAMLLMGIAPPITVFCFAYLILGFSFTTADAMSCALFVDYYGDKSAKNNSLLRSSLGLGGLIGPLFISKLIEKGMTWRFVLLILSGIALFSFFVFVLCAREQLYVPSNEHDRSLTMNFAIVKRFFLDPLNKWFVLCSLLLGVQGTGTVWIVRFMTNYLHAPQTGVMAYSLFWFNVAIARIILPFFTLSKNRSIIIGAMLSGILMTIGIISNNAVMFAFLLSAGGFSLGTVQPYLYDMCGHNSISNNGVGSSSASMLMLLFGNIGASFTLPLIGWVTEDVGPTAGMMVMSLSMILVACFAIPILLQIKRH